MEDHDPGAASGLDELLCFDLYAASRAMTSLYRPLLAELGLTYPQYLVLVVLWGSGPRTVGQLTDALCLDYGTLSPLLRRMSQRGLLNRQRDATDERSVVITLTEDGASMQSHSVAVQATVREALGLSGGEIRSLQERLRALVS